MRDAVLGRTQSARGGATESPDVRAGLRRGRGIGQSGGRAIRMSLVALISVLSLTPPLAGAEEADGARSQTVSDAIADARSDIDAGRCDRALQKLSALEGLESRARLLVAQCRIRKGLYPDALADLDRARGDRDLTTQQVGDIELYRGVALYHLERYTEAAAALDSAEGLTSQTAQLALYRGLLSLREGDDDRAAPALERAARLSPRLTEPVASYYAGLAWQGASERRRAREAFQRVIDIDGDGPWGKEAKKLLATTELFPYFVRGSAGMEFDSNVVLRGDNVTETIEGRNALTTVGEEAWRGVWEIDGGVQIFSAGDWTGGVIASYFGNAHIDVQDLNTHYPTVGGYLANRLGPNTVAQARYQFGHAWVDEQPYLTTHTGEASLSHTWETAGTTVVVADIISNDLLFRPFGVPDAALGDVGTCQAQNPVAGCSPLGVRERRERKRDGMGYGGALEHRYLVPLPSAIGAALEELEVGAGYRFRYYDARGEEWQHMSHIVSAGLELEFPLDFSFATSASYEYRDFENPSTFPDSETIGVPYALSSDDREEHEVNFEAEIEKDITDNFSVSTRYSYLNNDSNREVYEYDRHIVGGYFNFRFD